MLQFILNEKRTSGMCNKLEKDGNHQDMLKNKPESDMYACSIDTDNDESTPIFYDTDDDKHLLFSISSTIRLKYECSNSEGKTILRSSFTDSNRNLSAIKVPLP
jgi:hypothetical protein